MRTLILLCCLYSVVVSAQSLPAVITTESEIKAVTVFSSGAMVTREVSLSANLGTVLLEVTGLPSSIDLNTVVVEGSAGAEILSIKKKKQNLASDTMAQVLMEKESAAIRLEMLISHKLIQSLELELEMLKANQRFENESGKADIQAVILASEFYRTRVRDLLLQKLDEEQKIIALNGTLDSLQAVFGIPTGPPAQETLVALKVSVTNPSATLLLKYYVPQASWTPFYDIKVDRLDEDLTLLRKAFVSQSSTEDWRNVQLTLSTANPRQQSVLPSLTPYRLDGRGNRGGYRNTAPNYHSSKPYASGSPIYGTLIDHATGEPLIGASVFLPHTGEGTTTDVDGRFYLNVNAGQKVQCSYTGYETVNTILHYGENQIRMKEGMLLSEVVVTGLAARSGGVSYKKNSAPIRKEIGHTTIDAISSVEYVITATYNVLSGEEPIDLLIKSDQVPCDYSYHSVPSKCEGAFLTAEITDWHAMDLLPGKANLFLSNSYKGYSAIHPQSTKDTLSISLGQDPEVAIKRTQLRDYYSKKFLSRNAEEKVAYEIAVKNNKSVPITLHVLDQIPVSDNKDIEVSLKEDGAAQYSEKTGFMQWEMNLSPVEAKKWVYRYELKYPKSYASVR